MSIRKQTAINLALKLSEHASELMAFAETEIVTPEIIEAAKRVHAIKLERNAQAKTKATRVVESRARLLIKYLEKNINPQK